MRAIVGLAYLGLLIGCGSIQQSRIDRKLLMAAWTSHGGGFEFVINDDTILYEFDMREHPYKLEGNVLVVDFQDPSLGIQRKEIVKLTEEELVLRDVRWPDSVGTYRHVE